MKDYWNGNFPWIQSSDLKIDSINNVIPSKYITSEAITNSAAQVIPENSIAVVTRVGVGKLALMPYSYSTSQDFLSLSGLKVDMYYGIYVLYNLLKKESNNTQGTSIKGITKSTLLEKVLSVPVCIEEQQRIGAFFKQLDDTIALHQRKLELMKQMKRGYLQKMFPKLGDKVPEIRFAGFNNSWELCRFKDISHKRGKRNSKSIDYPAYSVSNKAGLVSQTDHFDGGRLDALEKTSYKLVEPLEFAYNPARINVGSIAFNNLGKTVIVSSLYVVVKMDDRLNNDFILQFIRSPKFIKEVKRNTEGSVREYLFYENFVNIRFPYTKNSEEQKQIGYFFKTFDDIIAHHQIKIEKLFDLKKQLLLKMFI